MNKEVKPKKQVKKVEQEAPQTPPTESDVLAMRKAQAAELAEKISPDFSLDQELHDIKTTLLDNDEASSLINEKGEVVKLPEEVEPKKPKPKKAPKQKEETTEAKPKQSKPKQAKPKEASSSETPKPSSEVKEEVLEKDELPFVKKTDKDEKTEVPEEKVIDNLQKLKDQIQAQKSLERELMKREAIKVQDKDVKLMDKLSALEELIRQTDVTTEGDNLELEAQNKKLAKQLSDANFKIVELQKEFDRINKEYDSPERIELLETIQRNEARYHTKIEELEELIKKQQEQVEERIRLELRKQKELQNKIKKLQSQTVITSQTAPTIKEIEDYKKILQKEFDSNSQKMEKDFLQKEKQLNTEKDNLIKKHEKALEIEKNKAEKTLLKKQEELLSRIEKLKLQYEEKLTIQKEKNKAALKEQKTKLEEQAKLKNNEQLEQSRLEYEEKLEKMAKQLLEAQEDAAKKLKEEKERLLEEQKLTIKEQAKNAKTDYEVKLASKEDNFKKSLLQKTEELTLEYQTKLNEKDELINQLKADYQVELAKLTSEHEKEVALWQEKYHNYVASEAKEASDSIIKMRKALDEANVNSEQQKMRISELETKLTNQASIYQKQLDEERARSLAFITEATKDLNLQRSKFDDELKAVKLESEIKHNTIREKYQEAVVIVENQRRDLERIKTQQDSSSHLLQEEKNRYHELERRLLRELDDRNDEIKKLKADIERVIKASETSKLETQLNQIAKLVDDLGNKSKDTPYQMHGYNYEYEKEYEFRKRLSEAMRREEEEAEKRKQEELKEGFNKKISGLEAQIQELGTLLKSKVENKAEQNEVLKNLTEDLASFKKQLKSEVENELKAKEALTNTPLHKLIDDYRKDKDILLYQYNNEVNNLEVDKKFASNSEIIKTIEEKIRLAKLRYFEQLKQRDIQFQRDLANLESSQVPHDLKNYEFIQDSIPVGEAPIVSEEKIVVSSEPIAPTENTIASPLDDLVIEEQDAKIEVQPIDANRSSKHSTVVYSKISGAEAFTGSVDQEYLRRLSNIKKLQSQLETRKKELTANYEADLVSLREEEARLIIKITEVTQKMETLKQEYEKKPFNSDNQKTFETENTKLNIELETRKEQLRQLREENIIKLNSRYQSALAKVEAQLRELLTEEQNLKAENVFKQQKLQNKIIREETIERKRQEEVGRIIESQEAIKQKNLSLAKEEVPLEEVKSKDTPTKEELPKKQETSTKEAELRQMYNKYVNVQKKLLADFSDVREYHEILEGKLGYEKEVAVLEGKLLQLEKTKSNLTSSEEQVLYQKKYQDLIISRDLYKDKIAYAEANLEKLATNDRIADYKKIIERINIMNDILKQYALKRG